MAISECMNRNVYSLTRSAIREYSRLAADTPGCIRLTLGEPDFATPDNISAQAIASIEGGDTHYIENSGARALREKISEFEKSRNGLNYSADEVIVSAGATEALFMALTGILNPGDEVIIPQPAFVLYEQIVKLAGAAVTPGLAFGSDKHIRISYCCSRDDLEKGLDRLQRFVSRLRPDG
jgi:aminotransferase